jgi:hypothetical protein
MARPHECGGYSKYVDPHLVAYSHHLVIPLLYTSRACFNFHDILIMDQTAEQKKNASLESGWVYSTMDHQQIII